MHAERPIDKAIQYHLNGELEKALEIYNEIVQRMPNNQVVLELLSNMSQGYFQLAQSLIKMGRIKAAVKTLNKVLLITPGMANIHFMLGQLLIRIKDNKQAAEHLNIYLEMVPEDLAGANMLLAHLGEIKAPEKPSELFIKSFYDNYAKTYDEHLVRRLNYKCPEIIYNAMTRNNVSNADILDLGCGTGLCGEAIKPLAKSIDGVDLSQPMLEVARQRNIYNELVMADIYEYMANKSQTYDVVIAAGLFEHIGDPEPILHIVHDKLQENGLFIFTTDENTDQSVGVNSAGFYMHGKSYLQMKAEECGFKVIENENVTMWIENKQPVSGLLVTLKRV